MLSPTGLLPSVVSEFHCSSASKWLSDSRRTRHGPEETSYNPRQATCAHLHPPGLGRSPFARHYSGSLG
jgi:hypothetical protein